MIDVLMIDVPMVIVSYLTRASSIKVRPVRWLWDLRLALGTLGLLGGREGIGKSMVAYTLGALLTRGRLPGVYFGTPKSIIVAATEDSWEDTIVPRLMAAGADLDRVLRADVIASDGTDGAPVATTRPPRTRAANSASARGGVDLRPAVVAARFRAGQP